MCIQWKQATMQGADPTIGVQCLAQTVDWRSRGSNCQCSDRWRFTLPQWLVDNVNSIFLVYTLQSLMQKPSKLMSLLLKVDVLDHVSSKKSTK